MLVGQHHRMDNKEIMNSIKAPNSFLLYQTKRRNDSNGQEVSSSQLLHEWNHMSNEQKAEFQNQSQCIQFTLDIDNRPLLLSQRLPKIVVPPPSSMLIPNDHASPPATSSSSSSSSSSRSSSSSSIDSRNHNTSTTDQLYNHHQHPQQHHYQPHHYQHSHHQLSDLLLIPPIHPLEKSFLYHPTGSLSAAAAEAAALESLSFKHQQEEHVPQDKNDQNLKKKYGTLPEKVKRPPNAYLLFNRDMRRQLKHVNQGLTSGEISKSISSKWKQLSAVQKEYYIAEEYKLKQFHNKQHTNFIYTRRSKAEMREADSLKKSLKSSLTQKRKSSSPKLVVPLTKETVMIEGKVSTGRDPRGRKKKKQDASLPKHPMSGYLHFAKEMRPIMKKQCPDARLVEISKQIGSQWRSMSEKELEPWQEIANKDKQRYAREMKDRILNQSFHDEYQEKILPSLIEKERLSRSSSSSPDTLDSHTIAAVAQMVNRNTTRY